MKNINQQRLDKLKNIIYDNLDPIVNGDYCLLDIPDHKNIGDKLIWAGELKYLSRLPYKMNYSSNLYLFKESRVKKSDIILLNGGGNFGDLWRVIQDFRVNIVQKFKNNKIVVFPVSVHYEDKELLLKDAEIFNKHSNITICVRDQNSYNILKKYFTNNTILLVPDMALCLDFSEYITTGNTNKTLYLKRTDKEINTQGLEVAGLPDMNSSSVEVKDWPTFNVSAMFSNYEEKIYAVQKRVKKLLIQLPGIGNNMDHRYSQFNSKDDLHEYIKMGIDFINNYDTIYSTRLHVFILSVLLNKQVYLLDNSYGKNSGLYNTWMKDFENLTLLNEAEYIKA